MYLYVIIVWLRKKICEESASFDFSSSEIACAISELNRVIEKLQEMQKNEDFASVDSESTASG
jgi:hypothetical protein